jgi:hypothetical protein
MIDIRGHRQPEEQASFIVLGKINYTRKDWKFIHSPRKFTFFFSLAAYIYKFRLEAGYI